MSCIYTAKYLLPGDAPLIIGGAFLDVGGRIAEIGTLAGVTRGNETLPVVDFGDAILLPPLVNAHTHLELTDYPRWAGRYGEAPSASSFVDWILQVIRVKHALPKENYLSSLTNGINLSMAAGTGAVGDIISHLPARKAYQGSLLLGQLYLETLGQTAAFIQQSLQSVEAVLNDDPVGSMHFGVSPHSPYTISGEYLAQLYAKCQHENLRCTTHVAESPAEVDFLQRHEGEISAKLYPVVGWKAEVDKAPGLNPVDYLQANGGLTPNNLLVHGVQLTRGEIDKVAAAGCSIALCPRSNARLDVGIAPVDEMLSAGVNLALGTDSLASCDSLSIWDEMVFAKNIYAGQVDAPALLRMATTGGAKALGIDTELGLLQSGYRSSFQVLRPQELPHRADIYDYLVAEGRSEEVEQLYLNGTSVLSG